MTFYRVYQMQESGDIIYSEATIDDTAVAHTLGTIEVDVDSIRAYEYAESVNSKVCKSLPEALAFIAGAWGY